MTVQHYSSSLSRRDWLKIAACGAFGVSLSRWPPAIAEDVDAKLPADGWWVRYYVVTKREETTEKWTMTRTYSLVGTLTENDQKCRWLEMKSVQTINGKEFTEILKFLIPQKVLLESEKPLDALVRAWKRTSDEQVKELKFNQPLGAGGFVFSADWAFGRDMLLFPGLQRKAIAVDEKKMVDYQRGRLDISGGRAWKQTATRQAITVVQKQALADDITIWNHAAVAPAFAAARTRLAVLIDDVPEPAVTSEWTIEDLGTDAKSALPDNN